MKRGFLLLLSFLFITYSCENNSAEKVCVIKYKPNAYFEYSKFICSNNEMKCFQFQNASDSINTETKYLWTFGDGSQSNLENPTHTYKYYGKYNVVLKVTNCNGQSSFASADLSISLSK